MWLGWEQKEGNVYLRIYSISDLIERAEYEQGSRTRLSGKIMLIDFFLSSINVLYQPEKISVLGELSGRMRQAGHDSYKDRRGRKGFVIVLNT